MSPCYGEKHLGVVVVEKALRYFCLCILKRNFVVTTNACRYLKNEVISRRLAVLCYESVLLSLENILFLQANILLF